ncbi:MAG: hypothetical protein WBL77_09790 [Pseudolabrys sp.]
MPYDNETAARKVRDAGLPKILRHRLIEGADVNQRALEAGP